MGSGRRLSMEALKLTQKVNAEFPMDPVLDNAVRGNVRGAIFSRVSATPLRTARTLATYSQDVLQNLLDLNVETVSDSGEFVDTVSGNRAVPSVPSLAHRYGGHQFGTWAGQLGDGRALLIGEYTNQKGDRWELQLKGAGMTPYSRFADGRAVIRSSVREFLCSEAMYHLGVPTSRAGTLVVCDDTVERDPSYSGRPVQERLAVVLRLAPSWFRFGSLQMPTADDDPDLLRRLADHLIERHFPAAGALSDGARYLRLAADVGRATGRMIAAWDSVGFTHGVMNTDNMSVHGLTIDYGPFGFMDAYDPDYVPNTSDQWGLYKFCNQFKIGRWNVCRLVEALMPLVADADRTAVSAVLEAYADEYDVTRRRLVAAKLGLKQSTAAVQQLYTQLLELMRASGADFTATFRQLGEATVQQLSEGRLCEFWSFQQLATTDGFAGWVSDYSRQLLEQGVTDEEERRTAMCAANPRYVLRNWMAQRAIEGVEKDDFEALRQLQRVLERPFTEQEEAETAGFADPPPDWSKQLCVSCSS